MMLDGNIYKHRVAVAEENLLLFRKSVERCNVPVMLDNSLRFLETIKQADNTYFNLPPKIKNNQKSLFNKSQAMARQYFDIKSNIGNFCECITSRQK